MAKRGATYAEMTESAGVSIQTVNNVLNECGLTKEQTKFKPMRDKMFSLYEKTGSPMEVAKKMGLPPSQVYYHLKKHYEGFDDV